VTGPCTIISPGLQQQFLICQVPLHLQTSWFLMWWYAQHSLHNCRGAKKYVLGMHYTVFLTVNLLFFDATGATIRMQLIYDSIFIMLMFSGNMKIGAGTTPIWNSLQHAAGMSTVWRTIIIQWNFNFFLWQSTGISTGHCLCKSIETHTSRIIPLQTCLSLLATLWHSAGPTTTYYLHRHDKEIYNCPLE